MSEAAVWDELTRLEQRALIKLFGGGSLRNNDREVVNRQRAGGFVDENGALAMPGLFVLTLQCAGSKPSNDCGQVFKNERIPRGVSISALDHGRGGVASNVRLDRLRAEEEPKGRTVKALH